MSRSALLNPALVYPAIALAAFVRWKAAWAIGRFSESPRRVVRQVGDKTERERKRVPLLAQTCTPQLFAGALVKTAEGKGFEPSTGCPASDFELV
jgi:hypothetical protein